MAPPKAQRQLEGTRTSRSEKGRKIQDGGSPISGSSLSGLDLEEQDADLLSNTSPASERAMHDMLQGLRTTLQADFKEALQELRHDVQDLGERTDNLETKSDDICLAHNDLVDRHQNLQIAHDALATKVADLEDRSRRNNMRIRGVPEAVGLADLPAYLMEVFQLLLPSASLQDLLLDRAHRLPKAKHLSPDVPRDVIVRVHFYHIKESLMSAARKGPALPTPYANLLLFADLSAMTLAKRREFLPLTKLLRNHEVAYRWGFPTKLLIWREGRLHAITNIPSGMLLLQEWGFVKEYTPPRVVTTSPLKVSPEWHRVKPK
uniref:Uncharacterized protein n=1 Tax=Leptobrachium leishanense TaxID=445787 RepID=A0A8C5M9B1_9ANUR